MQNVVCLVSFMLSVIYVECRKEAHYAECRYAECRYAESRGAKSKAKLDKIYSPGFM
jgi:hypothetical protein